MGFLGEVLGVTTAILFGFAIANFLIKWINRQWVMKLPKENAFRGAYQTIMKFLVKNHRFFGFGAAALMVAHIVITSQIVLDTTTERQSTLPEKVRLYNLSKNPLTEALESALLT